VGIGGTGTLTVRQAVGQALVGHPDRISSDMSRQHLIVSGGHYWDSASSLHATEKPLFNRNVWDISHVGAHPERHIFSVRDYNTYHMVYAAAFIIGHISRAILAAL